MHEFAKLFLPLLLIYLAAFTQNVAAVNTIAVNPTTYSVNENAGQIGVVVKLTRDVGNQQVVTVNFDTSNGTAIIGSDYFGASVTLTFGSEFRRTPLAFLPSAPSCLYARLAPVSQQSVRTEGPASFSGRALFP